MKMSAKLIVVVEQLLYPFFPIFQPAFLFLTVYIWDTSKISSQGKIV